MATVTVTYHLDGADEAAATQWFGRASVEALIPPVGTIVDLGEQQKAEVTKHIWHMTELLKYGEATSWIEVHLGRIQ